ncbi:MAG: family 10 glycosylhydrolase [Verrucomicrobiales bacterium]|nr:family 10 glycosylhydrolase [Verrucomicrobiales bacterium]
MRRPVFASSIVWLFLALFCSAFPLHPGSAFAKEYESLEDLRADRKKLAFQKRRIIANNDGCDCLYFPKSMEATSDNFLALRTAILEGSQVDTISYCTISSGFSHFTHRTSAGTILTRQSGDYGLRPDTRNITADLIEQGTDPLQAVVEFAKEKKMEAFWSFRMNDTHDVAHRPEKPYFLFPEFKEKHPEWLVGNGKDRTPHGRWSSVDYAVPEIRDLAFQFVKEVCGNYDVDGVEMDFFRHLTYFKSTAFGGKASPEECEMMTGLLRRIRTASEVEGMKRGHPILIAVRVPDDADFCRDMGLDVEQWMKERLIDMLITTGYFRLHSWSHSVDWAHRHGVSIYPALTDPRVKGEVGPFQRASQDAYRARAARAWSAGADGVYCFNLYDINRDSPLWNQIGDPEALAHSKKLYFVTDVDGNPDSWLAEGKGYREIPIVTPSAPATLEKGSLFSVTLETGEDTATATAAGFTVDSQLHLDTPGLLAKQLDVRVNDLPLLPVTSEPETGDWSHFTVPAEAIRKGENRIDIHVGTLPPASQVEWTHTYEGSAMPPKLWRQDGSGSLVVERLEEDGSLLIGDWKKIDGGYRLYRHSWGTNPEVLSVFEARAKIVSGLNYLIFTNGLAGERLRLFPNKILLHHHPEKSWEMDTTDQFHDYRIEIKGADVKVYVDGELRIDAPGAMTVSSSYPRNEICFGGSNHDGPGTAKWQRVRFRSERKGFALQDIALSVDYQKTD